MERGIVSFNLSRNPFSRQDSLAVSGSSRAVMTICVLDTGESKSPSVVLCEVTDCWVSPERNYDTKN